jgi:chemotaxis signal transduction protein
MSSSSIEQKLGDLRRDFDQSFSRAAEGEGPAQLDFLAIVVGGDSHAIRLSEVHSLHTDRKLVAAPSLLPELLGVCGFRSVLTPVYDLSQLLGYGPGPAARWLLVAQSAAPIAFAFGALDCHLRVPLESLSAPEAAASSPAAVSGTVRDKGITRPLLHLPSLVEAISLRIKAFSPAQER